MEYEIASYPEYENLVIEIISKHNIVVVISREPDDKEIFIDFFSEGCAPSSSVPTERSRIPLAVFLKTLEAASVELEA